MLEEIILGNTTVDALQYIVVTPHGTQELNRFEMIIIQQMMPKPGHIFSRDLLFEKLYSNKLNISHRAVDVHVSRLRKKFKMIQSDLRIISKRGVGYCLTSNL